MLVFVPIDKKFAHLSEFLKAKGKDISPIYLPSTELVGIVITKIKRHGMAYSGFTSDQTTHLRGLEGKYAKDIIKPYIIEGVGVPEALSRGYPVYDFPTTQNIGNMGFIRIFRSISDELKKKIDNI